MSIFLDANGAREVVVKIQVLIEELEATAEGINTAVTVELPEYWKGESSTKCQNTYDSDYRDFLTNKVPEMVNGLKEYINGCISAIEETDKRL